MTMAHTVTLRAPEPDDTDRLYLWENDPGTAEVPVNGAPLSRLQVWNYIQNYSADPLGTGELRLIAECGGEAVGHVDLTEIDVRNSRAQVSVYIDAAHRGRGLGRQALAAMVRHARRVLALHQVWALVACDNAASLALFKSLDFKPAGRLRSWLRRDGRWIDVVMLQYLAV